MHTIPSRNKKSNTHVMLEMCKGTKDGLLVLRWHIRSLKNDISLQVPQDKTNPAESNMALRLVKSTPN